MSDRSQYGEGQFILDHFAGRIGRFLDIGAFDGVTFSNTRGLAELGWSGVCVEPSPPAFCHLMRNYEGNANVRLVCAAVGGGSLGGADIRLRTLHCNTLDATSADMLSTLEDSHRAKFEHYPFRQIQVVVIDWDDLLLDMGLTEPGDLQFVNIDVEGINQEVLESMPIRPEMVCVEWDVNVDGDKPAATLAKFGYKNQKVIGGNILAW